MDKGRPIHCYCYPSPFPYVYISGSPWPVCIDSQVGVLSTVEYSRFQDIQLDIF
jgi:hypothetical protein